MPEDIVSIPHRHLTNFKDMNQRIMRFAVSIPHRHLTNYRQKKGYKHNERAFQSLIGT